jgi:hypothetical protein
LNLQEIVIFDLIQKRHYRGKSRTKVDHNQTQKHHMFSRRKNEVNNDSSDSVIFGLLSQVSSGKDISRISLPPVTLKPMSFLESLAVYSTPSNKLLSISQTDHSESSNRMIGVVSWMLVNMRDTPQRSLRRMKPTNPLLGETFFGEWHNGSDGTSTVTCVVAEQVSHHPPISALFWENKQYGLQFHCTARVYSTYFLKHLDTMFLGERVLYMINQNESYTIEIPAIRAKMALIGDNTVYWHGDLKIECKESGLRAIIRFVNMYDFSGTVERIDSVNNRKIIIANISGNFQKAMTMSPAQGSQIQFQQYGINFDAEASQTPQLICPPEDRMTPNESRVVWKDLFQALRSNNLELAGQIKQGMEEEQRHKIKQNEWDRKGQFIPSLFQQDASVSTENRPVYRYSGVSTSA